MPLAPNTSTTRDKAIRAAKERFRTHELAWTRRVIKRANDTMRMRGPECPRQNDTKAPCNATQCVLIAGSVTHGLQLSPPGTSVWLCTHRDTHGLKYTKTEKIMIKIAVGVLLGN